jgi:hypothetical protein
MAAATQISVAEYLNTTYRPDRDYVDGEVSESFELQTLSSRCR